MKGRSENRFAGSPRVHLVQLISFPFSLSGGLLGYNYHPQAEGVTRAAMLSGLIGYCVISDGSSGIHGDLTDYLVLLPYTGL